MEIQSGKETISLNVMFLSQKPKKDTLVKKKVREMAIMIGFAFD